MPSPAHTSLGPDLAMFKLACTLTMVIVQAWLLNVIGSIGPPVAGSTLTQLVREPAVTPAATVNGIVTV